MFYKCDSATSELLNRKNEISMCLRKHLNDEFHRKELTISKSRLFFISLKRADTIVDSWVFFLILLSCLSFYTIHPC